MKKAVLIKLSENVKDFSDALIATNEDGEVYLNLDHFCQYSFGEKVIKYALAGGEMNGCYTIKFLPDGMGEFHRIKREIEEFMGIEKSEDSVGIEKSEDSVGIEKSEDSVGIKKSEDSVGIEELET
jgi:hypothetical protein